MEPGELPLGSHQPTLQERAVPPALTAGELPATSKSGGVDGRPSNSGFEPLREFASSPVALSKAAKLG